MIIVNSRYYFNQVATSRIEVEMQNNRGMLLVHTLLNINERSLDSDLETFSGIFHYNIY